MIINVVRAPYVGEFRLHGLHNVWPFSTSKRSPGHIAQGLMWSAIRSFGRSGPSPHVAQMKLHRLWTALRHRLYLLVLRSIAEILPFQKGDFSPRLAADWFPRVAALAMRPLDFAPIFCRCSAERGLPVNLSRAASASAARAVGEILLVMARLIFLRVASLRFLPRWAAARLSISHWGCLRPFRGAPVTKSVSHRCSILRMGG